MSATGPLPQRVVGVATDQFRLDGTTAVVTGGSRNIGASIAMSFAQAGADVALVGRSAGALDDVAAAIRAAAPSRRVVTIPADVSTTTGTDDIIRSVRAELGHVDAIVNNAAAWGPALVGGEVLGITDEQWAAVLDTNLLGPYRLIAGLMSPDRTASVINVLSVAGFQPSSSASAYGVSKAALWMLTRYLAVELAPAVRVNAIVPGIISEDGEPRWSGHTQMLETGAVPMRRMGRPQEVAGAAVYLASPAASYTTGTVIFCNGGTTW